MRLMLLVGTGLVMLFAASCATYVTAEKYALRSNAVEDLKCNRDALRLKELDERTALARGCGRQATYTWNDEFGQWTSAGVRNDDKAATVDDNGEIQF